jgi:hypothetical protein
MAKEPKESLAPNELSTAFFELMAEKTADSVYERLREAQEGDPTKTRENILNNILKETPGIEESQKNKIAANFTNIFGKTVFGGTDDTKKEFSEKLAQVFLDAFRESARKLAGTDDDAMAPFNDETRNFLQDLARTNISTAIPAVSKLQDALGKVLQRKIDQNVTDATDESKKELCERRAREFKHAQEKLAEFRNRRRGASPPSDTPQYDNDRNKGDEEKKSPTQQAQPQKENLPDRLSHANGYHENALLIAIIIDWMLLGPTLALELFARTIKHGPSVAILMTLGISELDANDPGLSKQLLTELGVINLTQSHDSRLPSDQGATNMLQQQQRQAAMQKKP